MLKYYEVENFRSFKNKTTFSLEKTNYKVLEETNTARGLLKGVLFVGANASGKSGKVLLALSGGVDSSVAAALLAKAVGNQLTCIFVDHGFMRKNEGDEVEAAFADWGINFVRVNAKEQFMSKLRGVSDPETKRKTIGEEFIRVFEQEAKKIGTVDYLVQGTIYPDVIESGSGDAAAVMLSGFTDNYADLLRGVDIGGLGTPIASLASLISYKLYVKSRIADSRKYMCCFLSINAVFLVLMIFAVMIWK